MRYMIPTTLIDAIREGKCLPVIGAGFSKNAKLPDKKKMPTWTQLTEALAKKIQTKENDPLIVFQEFEDKSDRPTLIHEIEKSLFKGIANPGHVHTHFVKIPYFDDIVTTNYDDLLESACKQEGRTVRVIVEKMQISLYGADKELKIYKIHGDLEHSNELIITKKDYEKYYETKEALVTVLSSLLIRKTPIYIGFSFEDPNFIRIKEMIDTMMKETGRKGYIVLIDPTNEEIEKYKKLKLQVIPIETKGRSKSDSLLDFIKEIYRKPSTEVISTISVSANKNILFKNQKLEIRTNTGNDSTEPINIKIEKKNDEIVFESNMNNAIKISKGILSKEIILTGDEWEEEHEYTVYAEWQGQKISDSFFIEKPLEIIVQTDKSVYVYGAEAILTVIAPQAYRGSQIDYQILDKDSHIVKQGEISIDSEITGIFQEIVTLEGEPFKEKGDKFEILAKYEGKQASSNFVTSNFGAAIELDKKVYSWSEKVYITIVAPDFNKNSDKIDFIGNVEDSLVSIRTSKGLLSKYKLEETAPDTGIFVGEITLTGFPGIAVKGITNRKYPFGITRGTGPNDGLLACSDKDTIEVFFQFSNKEVFSGSALIRWNIGEIQFLEPSYSKNDYARVRVVDPDMNLDPNEIDSFNVRIWSDSDKKGISIPVYETNSSTGVFEGVISFDKKTSSNNGKLKVSDGDTVKAEYNDLTLPVPYTQSDELIISGTTMILSEKKKLVYPLDRMKIDKILLTDIKGNQLNVLEGGEPFKIKINIMNKQSNDQTYVIVMQMADENGIVIDTLAKPGFLKAKTTDQIDFMLRPLFAGKYDISTYIWRDISDPESLTNPKKIKINVINKS